MDLPKLYESISPNELKEHFKWKAALCQHPMYMLIDEDRGVPIVGERVPPWGAENADEYVKRVEKNLTSLSLYDDIKINYEFSAYELFSMCNAYPEVYQNIKENLKSGKLGFVNGSYSQPHLQILGSESNWHQFEIGMKTYKELFDVDVKLYVSQETALHKQISQLLKCFGIEFIALPAFSAAIEIIEGTLEMTIDAYRGFCPVKNDDFVLVQSLDGSTLPLYLGISDMMSNNTIYNGVNEDLYGSPKLHIHFPDLIEISEWFYKRVTDNHVFVIMEDELRTMLKDITPSTKVWLHTYWSYVEGVWAEELLRSSREAEQAALAAEAVMCMNMLKTGKKADEETVEKWWLTILKYQHHDVYWHEVTDLRRKAINANLAVKKDCEAAILNISAEMVKADDKYISAVNWIPSSRRTEIKTERNIKETLTQQYKSEIFGFYTLPPCGFKPLAFTDENAAPSIKTKMPDRIAFGAYEAVMDNSGLLKSIIGITPARCNNTLIGEIRCRIDGTTYDNRKSESEFFDGPVASIIKRTSSLKDVGLSETYYFYKNEGYIKAEIEFDFHGDEIGNFWVDDSKINILVPTSGDEVYHDIPFGYTEGKTDRPLFAINWLHSGGIVYVNGGNVKHSVHNGIISNVIAWGGTYFSNRMHMEWIERSTQYDIRLYGSQKIIYYIMPVDKFDGTLISNRVLSITTPAYTVNGYCDESFFQLERKDILVSSIYSKEGGIYYRGTKLPSGEKVPNGYDYPDFSIINEKIYKTY